MSGLVYTADQMLAYAQALRAARISCLPIAVDRPKAPALPSWKEYEARLPTEEEIKYWFRGRRRGIAAIGGMVSGGLECLDFDEAGLFERWLDDVDVQDHLLRNKLVVVRTPGGVHVWFRSEHCQPNQALARRHPTPQELAAKPKQKSYVLIETRGEGGYALLPGSPAECHEMRGTYYYEAIGQADICKVQQLDEQERSLLFTCARSANRYAEPPKGQVAPPRPRAGESTPGSDFETRGSWQEILEPHGWRLESGSWEEGKLTRPGKDSGVSATLGWCKGPQQEPLLNVFSTSAGLEPGAYGKFRAYTFLNHGNDAGNYSAAAKALGLRGFGAPPASRAGANRPRGALAQLDRAAGDDSELVIRALRGRMAKPIHWLIDRVIPTGKLTMIAGVGGMGKSTLMRHLVACLTTGRPACGLDYTPTEPIDVLLASVEDSPEDTIIPHLLAEGADLSRVLMIEGVRKPKNELGKDSTITPFELRDLDLVQKAVCASPQTRLLIIDPIMSFVGRAGANENSSAEVRVLLDPLMELAEKTGIAIVLIAHLNKATNAQAVNRIVGSTAFRDACRVVYAVSTNPNDGDQRVLALVKENVPGISRKTIGFRRQQVVGEALEKVLADEAFSALSAKDKAVMAEQLAVIQPLGYVACDADEALGSTATSPAAGKIEACMEWLKGFLREYAYPSTEIEASAKREGYSFNSLKEAKAKLGKGGSGVLSNKNFGGGRGLPNEWWSGLGPPEQWVKRPGKDSATEQTNSEDTEFPAEFDR